MLQHEFFKIVLPVSWDPYGFSNLPIYLKYEWHNKNRNAGQYQYTFHHTYNQTHRLYDREIDDLNFKASAM